MDIVITEVGLDVRTVIIIYTSLFVLAAIALRIR